MSSMLSESMPTSAAPFVEQVLGSRRGEERVALEVSRRAPMRVPAGPNQHRLAAHVAPLEGLAVDRPALAPRPRTTTASRSASDSRGSCDRSLPSA